MNECKFRFGTAWGEFAAVLSERGLQRLYFPGEDGASARTEFPLLQEEAGQPGLAVAEQVRDYFAGRRRRFSLALDLLGTPFQLAVWSALVRIPFGEVSGYGALAAAIGRPGAARAVGGAAHVNPVPIVIPCHRLVGANGALTGFGGGMEMKARLLELEGLAVDRASGRLR